MADKSVKLFLSCVSDEFGSYRDALRHALTRQNVEVKIQEDFKAVGGDTLMMLEEYIEHCDAVVHFAGEMTGSLPKEFVVAELLARRPDLKTRLPPLGKALDAAEAISYTQWEAWLAIYFGKDLVIAAPAPGVARGPKFAPMQGSVAAQTAHLARLRTIGRYPEVKFANADNLVYQIVTSAVIDALVKATAMPTRKPRNLPFASAKIFISYTSSDQGWAFWIAQELQTLGHTTYVHDWEIPAGGNIVEWMEKRLQEADHVLCVISGAYLTAEFSSWERHSGQWAAQRKRPNFVYPVFIEQCEPPTLMAHIKGCYLFGLDDAQEARIKLVRYLTPPEKLKEPAVFPGKARFASPPPVPQTSAA
jgi:TIR domain/Domain of unknown function (DUF4062)